MGTRERAEMWDERVAVARACRVLAHRGVVEDVLGHVSLRVDGDRALLRCRGPLEHGLRFTTPADVRLVDFDGAILDGGDRSGYTAPTEAPIHLVTMRRRADVRAVVHAHPPAAVVAGLCDIDLVPMFGSYDIPAARLAAGGIPVYGRSVLIRDKATADEMLASMGDRPACVLRGHGTVTVGSSLAEAMLRTLAVDRLCRIALAVMQASGRSATAIADADLAELPDLGAGLNTDSAWRFHLAALAADGWDLAPADVEQPAEARHGSGA